MIRKAVIPAAGLGTRLLPVTKELPKEMLPIFFKQNDEVHLKPMLQAVFEQLYDAGFREFGFIVGRGKRAIEDHFAVDESFVGYLKNNNKARLADKLQDFYEKLNNSTIVFINQPKPKGFGDAVYRANPFTGNESFLVHAGDDIVLSPRNDHLWRLMKIFEKYEADTAFLVEEVEEARGYGVIVGNEIKSGVIEVKEVFEKPRKPPSNLAIIAIYVFKPIIYQAIDKTMPDRNGEIQLTNAISLLLNQQHKVYALKLKNEEKRVDIGSPEAYLETLKNFTLNSRSKNIFNGN
jgi:UTP--glucose-1-phosphate uridylyltransferase